MTPTPRDRRDPDRVAAQMRVLTAGARGHPVRAAQISTTRIAELYDDRKRTAQHTGRVCHPLMLGRGFTPAT
jgi:hypothetical protein